MINKDIGMIYKLMIKTHNITGLKYLCITKKENWEQYTGSGTYWKAHLKKHGANFSTELLYKSENYDEFVVQCLFYSTLYNVALSKEFANQVPELGYDIGHIEVGFCNFEIWWKYASDAIKKEVIRKRNISITNNHWSKGVDSDTICDAISQKQIIHWNKFTLDERREMTESIRHKASKFFEDKETPEYKEYISKQSKNMLNYLGNIPFEVLSERNRKQRLNTSPESKQSRRDKIRAVYATGKHDALYRDMSIKRKGIGNPAAKIIVWEGKEYPKLEFEKFLYANNISEVYANTILDSNVRADCYRNYTDTLKVYDIIICPYCDKASTPNNKPSAFKRWHFDNCKLKD